MVTGSTKKRILLALKRLKRIYPDVHCALTFQNPYELLVATILSAQCTDERVNKVTPTLFKRFPTPQALSAGSIEEIEKLIYSTGFYRNKAKNLHKLAQELVAHHQSMVPRDLEVLESLPGVGRKTANVVLGNAFGIASGIAVDTHVTRLMNLLGVVKTTNADRIEAELKEIIPRKDWISFTHYFITHGRRVCIARRPQCEQCIVADVCPSARRRKAHAR